MTDSSFHRSINSSIPSQKESNDNGKDDDELCFAGLQAIDDCLERFYPNQKDRQCVAILKFW